MNGHRAFQQVDVFASERLRGNPVAVVGNADALSDAQMAEFARWTNLSETTFLLAPRDPAADYRLRIFTPDRELPFAGHPTLGSCHAWLSLGGVPKGEQVVQECAVGLVAVRRSAGRLAFAAPPLLHTGPVEPSLLARIVAGLSIPADAVVASQVVDNGPGWVAVMLRSRAEVLALEPDYTRLQGIPLGVVAAWDPATDGMDAQIEVRAFMTQAGGREDPVTGSLNASLAQWLIGAGHLPSRYVASQGTVLQRSGRVHVEQVGDTIWVGGDTVTVISGTVTI